MFKCEIGHECINYGTAHYVKDGFSINKIQRLRCGYCGKRLSTKIRQMLPILKKAHRDLSKEELYILGLLIADGQISNNGSRLVLTGSKDKQDYLLKIKKILSINNELIVVNKNNKTYLEFSWQHIYASPSWIYLGLTTDRSTRPWLRYMSSLDFVRGFLDGAGYIYAIQGYNKIRCCITFYHSSVAIVKGLSNYLNESLNLKNKTIYQQGKNGSYYIRYSSLEALTLCENLYKNNSDLKLPQKYQTYISIKNPDSSYLKAIETKGSILKPTNESKLLPILLKNQEDLSPIELYSLGLVISDGCLANNGTQLRLDLSIQDCSLLEIVKSGLCIPGKLSVLDRGVRGIFGFVGWQNKDAKPYWLKLGLASNKTGKETWLSYMTSPHFIRGYLDGDGCFYYNKEQHKRGHLEFACANKTFLLNLAIFLSSTLQISQPTLYTKNKGKKDWFVLYYSKSEAILIGDYVYQDSSNIRLERKYNKYLDMKRG